MPRVHKEAKGHKLAEISYPKVHKGGQSKQSASKLKISNMTQ